MIRKEGRTHRRVRKLMWKFHTPESAEVFGVRLPIRHPLIAAHIQKEIALGGYERKEIDILQRRLTPEDRVLEIGAGIGFLSAWCARRLGDERVHAVEANPALMELIALTHRLNGVAPGVSNVVLGRGSAQRDFYVEPEFWASSLARRSEQARVVKVPQRDLNEELRRLRPSFLIVDIEGGELDLFEYAQLDGVDKICVEVHPDVIGSEGVTRMLRILIDRGFVLDCHIFRKNVLFLYRPAAERAAA